MDGHKFLNTGWILSILVLCKYVVTGLELSAYEAASFSINPPLEFTHLASHNETGTVYLGASDVLYQLGEDFVRQVAVNTAVSRCDENEARCPNFNKILLIDYAHDRLITCGSENQGTCQTRNLTNIDTIIEESDIAVVSSGKLTTESILGPGPEKKDVLYVSATYDIDRYEDGVVPLQRRSLDSSIMFSSETSILLNIQTFGNFEFVINYAEVFLLNDYTYFLTSQILDSGTEARETYVTKLNRICQQPREFSDSYAEIILSCGTNNQYNLIQAAYVGPAGTFLAESLGLRAGDDVLFGVFAESEGAFTSPDVPSNQSALCIFKLQDIEEAFIDVVYGCLSQGESYQIHYIPGSFCKQLVSKHKSIELTSCHGYCKQR